MQMRSICAAGMMAALAWSGVAQAAPTGSTVQAGTAAISSASNGPGTTVTVNQSTDQLYVDWSSFNIDAADVVDFVQNTSQSIAVNRVTGGSLSPTTIDGILNANGHVWILDPSGIAFGATATVNIGGLLVTTANIDPAAFMSVATLDDAGGFTFTSGGNSSAVVSNAGTINSSGLLALVAPFVDNSGNLTSSYGDVLLGGAEAFRVSFSEVARSDPTPFDELLVTDFIIDTPVTNDPTPGAETVPVTNTGSLTGANVIATAASVGGGAFINMDGVLEATNVGTQSGDIVLLGGGDFTGGAADATSGATEAIRIKNADLTAAGDLVAQGSNVSIEKGTGPGALTAGAARVEATSGDVTSDASIETTAGGVDIKASNLASLSGIDGKTTVDVTAKDIDLDGLVNGDTSVTLEATDVSKDISGTDIDITGGSIDLTGKVAAIDSATIQALTSDATLNDDITSTGSILIEALSGKASVKGVDADTTTTITAKDIDLDGLVNGDTSVTLEATDVSKDISGTDIDITGGSVDLTGKVAATDSATIQALTSDVTLNDDLTSTGSVLIEALLGKVTAAGLSAVTTLEVHAKEILIPGDAVAGDDVTIRASHGDATLSGNTESTNGNVLVEAKLGTASVFDVASHLATTITGGAVKVLGDLVSTGQVTLQALTGNVDVQGSVTANGGLLLLNAAQGDAVINRIASTTNVSIQALDLDLSGSISAGDEVILTSLDSGTTIVLGGDGGVGSFTLRKPQGLTIDAGELGRISAGNLRIDADGNDALLRSVDFSGATLGDLSIGANGSSWIMTDGTVKGLNTLTLGYVDGLDDRRPELVLVAGSLGEDTAGGADWLGDVVINSSQDIIIGSQAFRTYYETKNPTLSQLGSPALGAMGVASNHVFIATNSLELYAPGDIVQLNTGSGVDGKGLVFRVSAVGKAVINPVDGGPEKVVLFGTVVRDDDTRVTSFSAGLEPRLLYEGEKDGGGKVIVEPLAQSDDYHFNLCIIGDPVSCSNALLRQAEGTSAAADSDPNPAALQTGLTFDTDDKDDDDEDDTSGVAATGNESLWGASAQ